MEIKTKSNHKQNTINYLVKMEKDVNIRKNAIRIPNILLNCISITKAIEKFN